MVRFLFEKSDLTDVRKTVLLNWGYKLRCTMYIKSRIYSFYSGIVMSEVGFLFPQ